MKKPLLSTWNRDPELLDFSTPNTWYKGGYCNRFPSDRPIIADDILHGWVPERKLIRPDTRVLAFGSCFAEYFIKFLSQRGYNEWQLPHESQAICDESLLLALGQTFENIFVILQQFRWAFSDFAPQSRLWFTKDKKYFEATEERREKIRRSFEKVDVFVITLGLSEIWFDRISNEPMWRSVPAQLYEADRHAFRRATVSETLAALYELDSIADRFFPEKRFIFTLSPVPFIATFRNQSAITANQASKAVLRAALDEFICNDSMQHKSRYYYFPSYELVSHLFDRPFLPDNRHVRPHVASVILDIFSQLYTDLPSLQSEILIPENSTQLLETKIHELESQLAEKEKVIQELGTAARDRLEIIMRLNAHT